MLRFFRSDKDQRIKNKIELVSVHIPKTAGTSFRNILKTIYGEEAVVRIDIPSKSKVRVNQEDFKESQLDKHIKVAHGHFSPEKLQHHFKVSPEVPVITWLRDPVERVISNYYYLEKILQGIIKEEERGVNILSKMQCSLVEYASREICRNRMSKFLAGIELEELRFVGIQEYFSEDLQLMGKALGWPDVKELYHNATGKTKREVSEAERAEISRLNEIDIEIYQRALALRNLKPKH